MGGGGVSEMTLEVEELVTRPDGLSLPRSLHMVEGEKSLPKLFCDFHIPALAFPPPTTQTHTQAHHGLFNLSV